MKPRLLVGEAKWVKHMLLYYNKHFQLDQYFPLIAFNQRQMKQTVQGGLVLVEHKRFDEITKHILSLNISVLEELTQ